MPAPFHSARRTAPATLPAVLLSAILFVLAACSGGAASQAPSPSAVAIASATPAATPSPTPSPTPAPAFPTSITDDEGTVVKLDAEPAKIVSLTPAVTETLFAVGAGSRIVATETRGDNRSGHNTVGCSIGMRWASVWRWRRMSNSTSSCTNACVPTTSGIVPSARPCRVSFFCFWLSRPVSRASRTPAEWALYALGLAATIGVTVFVTRLARQALARRARLE